MSNKEVVEVLLETLEKKRCSLADLERNPPDRFSRRDVRIGVQTLVDSGKVQLDRDMKLVLR